MFGRWWGLSLLLLVNVLNQWDRYLLPYLSGTAIPACRHLCKTVNVPLCEDCSSSTCLECHECLRQHDSPSRNIIDGTCLTGSEYGVLTGIAFAAVFVTFGLMTGRIADRVSRKSRFLAAGLLLWSTAVVAQSFAVSFWTLLPSRVVLAMGESVAAPTSYALIGVLFPPVHRGRANGIYSIGIYVGGGLASLSLLLSEHWGWRWTTRLVGALGVPLIAVLLTTLRDDALPCPTPDADEESAPLARRERPQSWQRSKAVADDAATDHHALLGERSAVPSEQDRGYWSVLRLLHPAALGRDMLQGVRVILSRPVAVWLLVASAVRFVGGYSIASFLVLYFKAAFPEDIDAYSVTNAIVVSVGGSIAAFGGGWLADATSKRLGSASRAWLPAGMVLLAIPCMAGVLYVPSFYAAMVCLFAAYLLAEGWFGPIMSLLQSTLPKEEVGFASAVFVFLTTLVGSTAPALLGKVYDSLHAKQDIRGPLLGFVGGSYALSAAGFFIAARLVHRRATCAQP